MSRPAHTYRPARRAAMRQASANGGIGPRTLRQSDAPVLHQRRPIVPPYASARAVARYSRQIAAGQKTASNGVACAGQ